MSKPKRQREGEHSDAIVQVLRAMGLLVHRNALVAVVKSNRMVRGGLGPGSSDLVAILPPTGRVLFLEVKVPGEIPSAARIAALRVKPSKDVKEKRDLAQWDWLAEQRLFGAFACYVDSPEAARDAVTRAREGGRC